jgi:transcriptional regulator with XRE-family HTH domain
MAKFYNPKNKIREVRQRKNMTQDEIYLKVGIHQARLSKLERGIFEPNEKERKLLIEALEASEKELFPEA